MSFHQIQYSDKASSDNSLISDYVDNDTERTVAKKKELSSGASFC